MAEKRQSWAVGNHHEIGQDDVSRMRQKEVGKGHVAGLHRETGKDDVSVELM